MIMAIISLLFGRSHASKSQETKLFQSVHYKFLCMVCYTIPSIFLFYLSSKLNLLCENLVIKALTNLMAHFIFLPLINLNHCVIYVVYACTFTLELAES